MRPRHLLPILFFIGTVALHAEPVDSTKALAAARSFYNGVLLGKEITKSADQFTFTLLEAPTAVIDRGGTKGAAEEHLYYIFNVGEMNGFVIVSGDDAVKPVLGYSINGEFKLEGQPPALAGWLAQYRQEITEMKKRQQKATPAIAASWDRLSAKAPLDPVLPVVGPLLENIEWNQGLYYNDQCPADATTTCPSGGTAAPGGHVYAGCVATAMAQIMRYHSFPNQGILDDTWDHPDYPVQTANVTTTTYDWNGMPDELFASSTSAEVDEVSRLIAHCAVLLHMDYGPCGSGASTSNIPGELESHFGYAEGAYYDQMDNYTFADWVDLLQAEIDAARPVSYRGSGSGGHSFVCDGYDAEDKFHFNWGWSGTANGYFELTSLDPLTGYVYTDWQAANFEIKIPEDNFEPNNILSNATLLDYDPGPYNSIIIGEAGSIDVLADQDIYMLNLPGGYDYQISARVHDFNSNALEIYYSADVQIEYNDGAWSSAYDTQIPEFSITDGGVVYFRVSGDNLPAMHNTGTYGIEITYTRVGQPSLYAGAAQPSPALTDQPVQFSVEYKDPENDPPSSVIAYIDGTGYAMTASGSVFASGVTYEYSTSFGSDNPVEYYFTAQTADGQSLRYPEAGSLTLDVIQNAAGHDLAVSSTNTGYDPSSPDAGTTIDVQVDVRNNGVYSESGIPVSIELRSPAGTLLDSDNTTTGTISAGASYMVTGLSLQVPSGADDGTYAIICTVLPPLDSDPSNNSYTLHFNIGVNLPNDQCRVDQQTEMAQGDIITLNYLDYELFGVNITSQYYAGFIGPDGDMEVIHQGEIEIYGTDDVCLAVEAVYAIDAVGYAAVYGGVITDVGMPVYANNNIQAYPGQTITFSAAAPSGLQFENNDGNHEAWMTSLPNVVDSWYNGIDSDDGYLSGDFEFRVPSDAALGEYRFYFQNEYETGTRSDFTRLTINVVAAPPQITSLGSYQISADDNLTISGSNLGTGGTVYFGNVAATGIISWTTTAIECIVPEGVANGNLTVVTNGTVSNGISYQVISSTGDPVITYHVPDMTIHPGDTLFVGYLENFFDDPNGDVLSYDVTSTNSKLGFIASSLQNDSLYLVSAPDQLWPAQVTISATDADNATVMDQFIVNVSPVLMVSPVSDTVSYDAGSVTFQVHSNLDWNPASAAGWIDVNKVNDSTLVVNYQANTTLQNRSADITLSAAGYDPQLARLFQIAPYMELSISECFLDPFMSADGMNTCILEIDANIEWTIQTVNLLGPVDWMGFTENTATTEPNDYIISSTVQNTKTYYNIAEIQVNTPVAELADTIRVTQRARYLTVDPSLVPLGSGVGAMDTVIVRTNYYWDVLEPEDIPGWLDVSVLSGYYYDTLQIQTLEANPTATERLHELHFRLYDNAGYDSIILDRYVSVTQEGYINNAPVLANPISDTSVYFGFDSLVYDVTDMFSDPDGDLLSLHTNSSDSAVAIPRLTGNTLIIDEIGSAGTATILVTAHDGQYGTYDSFDVTVEDPNQPPYVANPISDVSALLGTGAIQMNVAFIFADPDGDALSLHVSSSDSAVAVPSLSGTTLTLDILGVGTADILLTATDGAFGAVETFSITVTDFPWTYDPAGFSLNGQVTGKVFIDDVAVEGGYLGAFVGEECRGYIEAIYFGPADHYVFMLMIQSNNATGETVHFRYYDPVADTIIPLMETVEFTTDMTIGDASDPFALTNRMNCVVPLVAGWNWVSLNVHAEDMTPGNLVPGCTTEGDYIKNQTLSTQYYSDYGWFGPLDSLTCTDLYKVRMSEACAFDYVGSVTGVETCRPLAEGWSWISFPVHDTLPVADALASLTPMVDDYVKNQTQSTQYYDGYGWFGSLEYMVPGDGYMVRLGHTDTICFPFVMEPVQESARKSAGIDHQPGISFNPHVYEFNGSLTASLENMEVEPGDFVYAFADGQCRGFAAPSRFAPTDRMVFPLMVFSNEAQGDKLSFVFYDASADAYFRCHEQVVFASNMVVNDAVDPLLLNTGDAVYIEEGMLADQNMLSVYPNPFKEKLYIEYSTDQESEVMIELYDMYGRLIRQITGDKARPGIYTYELDSKGLPSGTYLLKTISDNIQQVRRVVHLK